MQLTLFLFTLNTTFHLNEPELCQISASIISSRLLMLARSHVSLPAAMQKCTVTLWLSQNQCLPNVQYLFLVLFTDTVF